MGLKDGDPVRRGGLDRDRELPLLAAGVHNGACSRRRDALEGGELGSVIPEAREAPSQSGADIAALTEARHEPGLDIIGRDIARQYGEQPGGRAPQNVFRHHARDDTPGVCQLAVSECPAIAPEMVASPAAAANPSTT
ncbi:hypothetical protein GCM10029978_080040 [Actinoallomurus acanthiterrae]